MEKIVLIVEDEVLVGMMLSRKLEGYGFTVCDVVGTGEEAVIAAEQSLPGAILMDVSLGGGMDGIEAAEKIQSSRAVPIVFFTGYNQDRNLMERMQKLNVLAVLDKLGPVEGLLAALESAFE